MSVVCLHSAHLTENSPLFVDIIPLDKKQIMVKCKKSGFGSAIGDFSEHIVEKWERRFPRAAWF